MAFDLEQFALAPRPEVDPRAIELARALIQALRDAPPHATPTQVLPRLGGLPGNKGQRRNILIAFGFCGILSTPGHPNYADTFVAFEHRNLAPGHFMDTNYPACWWRGHNGIDEDRLRQFLPDLAD